MQNSKIRNTFETLERLTIKAAQPVKQVAADVGRDIQESLGLSSSTSGVEQLQPLPTGQKQQIKQADATKQAVIRQNIARINQQIVEARKKREERQKHPAEPDQALPGNKQIKQMEQKKKETVLQKMIKSRMGTKEGMQRASG